MDEQSFQPLDADVTDDHGLDNDQLYITEEICEHWRECSQWTYGLAIVGFIALGVLFLGVLVLMNTVTIPAPEPFILIFGVAAFVLAALSYNLMRFSSSIRKAADYSDWDALETGFACLRNAYGIYGVLTVILVMLFIFLIAYLVSIIAYAST